MRRNSVAAVVDLNPRLRFALQFSYHLAVFANDLADCRRRNHDVFLDGMSEGELSVFALLPANLVDAPLGKLDVIRAAPVCDYPRLALRDVLVNIDSSCGSCLQIADHLATFSFVHRLRPREHGKSVSQCQTQEANGVRRLPLPITRPWQVDNGKATGLRQSVTKFSEDSRQTWQRVHRALARRARPGETCGAAAVQRWTIPPRSRQLSRQCHSPISSLGKPLGL
mmetsp:Transcript_36791/g.87921  ORF Transcript_36791/g.87921 Transcript_36791/m.87921 type:complete len:225 (+) Transcript_36791:908-1582(+)